MVSIAAPSRVSPAGTAPAPPAVAPAPARDRVLDLVRIAAIVLVVAQHWLVPILAVDGGAIVLERANVLESLWPATWITQVMPLVFFTSGAAAALSLRGRPASSRWVSTRLTRLIGGVVVLALVWLPMPWLLLSTGLDPAVVSVGARLIGALLWFLVVLVILTGLTPVLRRLAERHKGVELAVLAAAAVAVDALRFGLGWEDVGYLNALLVWAAVYTIGIHYAHGRLAALRGGRAVAAATTGMLALGAAVAIGGYPPAMIGLPGTTVSNMNPPSAALLALAVAQIGLLLAFRPALARLVGRRPVAALVDRCAPHTMTVYLWHTPAIVLVAAVVVALGQDASAVGSAAWWWQLPAWCLAASAVLAMSVAGVGRAGLRPGSGRVGTARAVGGGMLACAGLAALMVGGFDPARWTDLAGPLVGVGALIGAAALMGARPHADLPSLRRSTARELAGAATPVHGKVIA